MLNFSSYEYQLAPNGPTKETFLRLAFVISDYVSKLLVSVISNSCLCTNEVYIPMNDRRSSDVTRKRRHNVSSPLILQDSHKNFKENERKRCKNKSVNIIIRDTFHFSVWWHIDNEIITR